MSIKRKARAKYFLEYFAARIKLRTFVFSYVFEGACLLPAAHQFFYFCMNNPLLRFAAQLISVVCHPLLLLMYALLLLAWANPYLFSEGSFQKVLADDGNRVMFFKIFAFTVAFPLFAIFIMRGLNLIDSLAMKSQQERIGPFIITGLMYVWVFYNLKQQPAVPLPLKTFALGATIGLFSAFVINLFSKISLHTVGMGGFLGMVLVIMAKSYSETHGDLRNIFLLTILLAGLVGSARLVLRAHQPSDIYGGYFVGLLAQLIAIRFIPPFIG